MKRLMIVLMLGLMLAGCDRMWSEDQCLNASVIDVSLDEVLAVCGDQPSNQPGGAQSKQFERFKQTVMAGNATVYLGTDRRYNDGSCYASIDAYPDEVTISQLITGGYAKTITCRVNGIVK